MASDSRVSYLICSTPRSGSTLLTEALRGTDIAGRPDEYFLPTEQHIWQKRWGVTSARDYVDAAIQAGSTPNGAFGAKIMWDYFDDFVALLRHTHGSTASSPHDVIASVFPNVRYIWITRRDKIRQAISHARAIQSDFWHDWETDNSSSAISEKAAEFHFSLVSELLHTIILQEASWGQYFASSDIIPLTVVYEDLAANYEGKALEIAEHLGLPVTADLNVAHARTRKQADMQTEDWVQRYLRRRQMQRTFHLVASIPLALRNRHIVRKMIPSRDIHPPGILDADRLDSN